MNDVGAFAFDQRTQRADLTQRPERLARDRELDVLATFGDERRHQASAARNDDRTMTGADERAADFERRTLRAARVERRNQLNDGEATRGHSVDEDEVGAAIGALRAPTIVGNRQINLRMRIPE